MDKPTKIWVQSTEAWLKTQENSIDSCFLNIQQNLEQIKLLKKHIQLERAEKKLKVAHYKTVKVGIDNFKKDNK